ncbi:nickel-dependent lactate racemase [Candidatus Bipolaricaulota bacterium]|nr:nickel-dependent lactate racemase [Candidatus Bipolaricaulota bacterium]
MTKLTPGRPIDADELQRFIAEEWGGFGGPDVHVPAVVTDDTRTIPIPAIFDELCEHVPPRVDRMSVLIALGTHPQMTEPEPTAHLGAAWCERAGVDAAQHDWWDDRAMTHVETIPASALEALSGGRLSKDVPVRINSFALDVDRILIVDPVFPHEAVGFSGGHKYFFPAIVGGTNRRFAR